jgi:hypothetical protein
VIPYPILFGVASIACEFARFEIFWEFVYPMNYNIAGEIVVHLGDKPDSAELCEKF